MKVFYELSDALQIILGHGIFPKINVSGKEDWEEDVKP